MAEYESVLLVKPEVFIYKIPPRTTARGYRAADWNLAAPEWTGRLRLVAQKEKCILKLEDKISGELFAKCPIEKYPSVAIESVTDSSRYFVIRIESDDGKSAFIGLGFGDRSDSFDMNVALQDHFKWVNMEEEAKKDTSSKPTLDLGFKEGETIKINMKITKKDGQEGTSKQKPKSTGGIGLLPPPPGGIRPAPSNDKVTSSTTSSSNVDLLGGAFQSKNSEPFGDFASAGANNPQQSNKVSSSTNSGWVQF